METPWAKPVGSNQYELDNSLWFAHGISWQDVFEATPEPDDPRPHFRRVLRKSGNRTVRLVLKPPTHHAAESAAILTKLREMGCSYEGANHTCFAVNVPPEVDLESVARFLTSTGQQWERADPSD